MPQFQIPTKSKKWIQPNKGDIFGNLFATFNMDFDVSEGKVRVARRMVIRSDSTDDADLGIAWAFVRSSTGTDRWWAGCGTSLFRTASTNPAASYTEAATDDGGTTAPPTSMTVVSSDAVVFNGKFYVSLPTNIAELDDTVWDNDWWTTIPSPVGTALTTGIAHPLCVSLKTNLLMVGDGNLLHTIDKNENAKNSRVILPIEFEIMWIRSSSNGSWIGARNKINGEAKVFYWDEYSENFNQGYELKSDMTFAGVIKDGICYTVNGEGQLLKFTGSGFEEVAVFPVFNVVNGVLNDGNTVRRSIQRNGMAVIDNKIHINISSQIDNNESKTLENFPSGIWTYDEKQGLRHKYAFTQERAVSGSEIDYGAFFLTEAGAIVNVGNSTILFLAGAKIATNATASITAICYPDPNEQRNKRGHFITSIFESSAFEDIFKEILLTFKRLRNSGDRIIIKYRAIKNPNYPIIGTGTWSSTTVFTATSADLGSLANIIAGDEVMVIKGRGAGTPVKISSVSEAGGTYTITLAEAITGVSGTMTFFIGDWTEAATISTQSIERQSFDLDVVGTFIQLKVEMRSVPSGTAGAGDSPEIEKIVINSTAEEII